MKVYHKGEGLRTRQTEKTGGLLFRNRLAEGNEKCTVGLSSMGEFILQNPE